MLKPEMKQLRPILGEIVSTLESRAPYGAVTLSSKEMRSFRIDNTQEQVVEGDPTAGAILTVFDEHTLREKAISGFDISDLNQGAKELIEDVRFHQNGKLDPGPERKEDYQTSMKQDPTKVSTDDKLDYLRELNRRINAIDSQVVNARVNYVEMREKTAFRNRTSDLAQDVQRVRLTVYVIVKGENKVVYNWESKEGTAGLDVLTFSDEELEITVKDAIQSLTADRIEPGEYEVITSPKVSGTICHESFGHGVETDMFLKKRAKAANFIEKRVGSDLINIYDDPSYLGAYGSYFFDDEGFPAAPTQIVENGIFKRGITDLYSATVLDIPRSSNGRRQDLTRKVYPRMTNTFFGPGESSLEDLLGMVKQGVYLSRWSSGMEDPKGWGIQISCVYGFEIKNGKLTDKMYAPIGMTGYVPEVLSSIKGISNDFRLDGGSCGKGAKEIVPVTSGGPHLLMKARLG